MFIFKQLPCLLLFVTLLLPANPLLQAQTDDKVYTSKDGIVLPKTTHSVEPGYTDEAQAQGIMGDVTVSLEIGKDGKPRNIKIVQGLDPGLDKNAVAALSEWRFDPGTKDGHPVITAATIRISFRLQ
jgi:TonB family protein